MPEIRKSARTLSILLESAAGNRWHIGCSVTFAAVSAGTGTPIKRLEAIIHEARQNHRGRRDPVAHDGGAVEVDGAIAVGQRISAMADGSSECQPPTAGESVSSL